ncbi:MAG TPA: SIMPL domain-containing protein [Candidatus Kapabacteria bacterium]|nr:SIMPL domain-containing protein [Candidatus Kapabacteria bacterium]
MRMNNAMCRASRSASLLVVPFLVLLCAAAAALRAQPPAPQPARTISVSGDAEMRVVPDQVQFDLGIETENKDIEEATRDNDNRLNALLDAIEKLGIARQDVQTNQLTIAPEYAYKDGRRGEFLGFSTSRNVSVTLKNFGKTRNLIAAALKAGVTNVGQGQLRTSELRKYRDEARVLAIRAAKDKALLLAHELGVKVGRVLTIEETPTMSMYANQVQTSRFDRGASGEDDNTLAPGELSVSARVSVVFELE